MLQILLFKFKQCSINDYLLIIEEQYQKMLTSETVHINLLSIFITIWHKF